MERDGIEVVLRHPDRPLFAEGITKQQLADYYAWRRSCCRVCAGGR